MDQTIMITNQPIQYNLSEEQHQINSLIQNLPSTQWNTLKYTKSINIDAYTSEIINKINSYYLVHKQLVQKEIKTIQEYFENGFNQAYIRDNISKLPSKLKFNGKKLEMSFKFKLSDLLVEDQEMWTLYGNSKMIDNTVNPSGKKFIILANDCMNQKIEVLKTFIDNLLRDHKKFIKIKFKSIKKNGHILNKAQKYLDDKYAKKLYYKNKVDLINGNLCGCSYLTDDYDFESKSKHNIRCHYKCYCCDCYDDMTYYVHDDSLYETYIDCSRMCTMSDAYVDFRETTRTTKYKYTKGTMCMIPCCWNYDYFFNQNTECKPPDPFQQYNNYYCIFYQDHSVDIVLELELLHFNFPEVSMATNFKTLKYDQIYPTLVN